MILDKFNWEIKEEASVSKTLFNYKQVKEEQNDMRKAMKTYKSIQKNFNNTLNVANRYNEEFYTQMLEKFSYA